MTVRTCVILGAGFSGLTLADKLSDQGMKVIILEKSSQLGGLGRRVTIDGSHVDIGPHNLRSQNPLVIDYWKDLLGDDLLIRFLPAQILFRGQLLSYPIKPFELLSTLPLPLIFSFGAHLLLARFVGAIRSKSPNSFADWAISNFGQPLYDYFFRPLTEKTWGVPAASLDADFALQRVPSFSLRQLVFKAKKKLHGEDPLASAHHYPRHGIYQLIERLAKRLTEKGVVIHTGVDISKIEESGEKVTLHWKKNQEVHTTRGDFLASSISVLQLLALYGKNEAPPKPELQYRGLGLLYVSVPEDARLEAPFVYCADESMPFNRLTDFSYCSPQICAKGKNVLCIEFHINSDQSEEVERYCEEILSKLKKLKLVDLGVIYAKHIEVVSQVYPLYICGYQKYLQDALKLCLDKKRLLSFGRHGMFAHINIDKVMEMAFEAADLISKQPYDESSIRRFYQLQ